MMVKVTHVKQTQACVKKNKQKKLNDCAQTALITQRSCS